MIKQKDLVYVLGSSTVIAFIWMGSTFYHSYITSTIKEPLTSLLRPIPNRFDPVAVDRILKRQETVPTYEGVGEPLEPTPTSSASATLPISDDLSPTPTTPEVSGGQQP